MDEEETCSICLEPLTHIPEQVQDYYQNDSTSEFCSIIELPNCNHRFHWFCINISAMHQVRQINHPTCPLCRASTIADVVPTNHVIVNSKIENLYFQRQYTYFTNPAMTPIFQSVIGQNQTLLTIISTFIHFSIRRLTQKCRIAIHKSLLLFRIESPLAGQYAHDIQSDIDDLRTLEHDPLFDVPAMTSVPYNERLYRIILQRLHTFLEDITLPEIELNDKLFLFIYLCNQIEIHKEHPERNLPQDQAVEFWKNALAFKILLRICCSVAPDEEKRRNFELMRMKQNSFLTYCGVRPENYDPSETFSVEYRTDLNRRALLMTTRLLNNEDYDYPVWSNVDMIDIMEDENEILQIVQARLTERLQP